MEFIDTLIKLSLYIQDHSNDWYGKFILVSNIRFIMVRGLNEGHISPVVVLGISSGNGPMVNFNLKMLSYQYRKSQWWDKTYILIRQLQI